MLNRILVVVFAVVVGLGAVGCVMPNEACIKTVAARASANAMLADAVVSLQQAADVVSKIQNPEVRGAAMDALEAAQISLRAASGLLASADAMCSAPDLRSVFAEFVEAWRALAPFLALLGGPSGTQVQAPIVVGL